MTVTPRTWIPTESRLFDPQLNSWSYRYTPPVKLHSNPQSNNQSNIRAPQSNLTYPMVELVVVQVHTPSNIYCHFSHLPLLLLTSQEARNSSQISAPPSQLSTPFQSNLTLLPHPPPMLHITGGPKTPVKFPRPPVNYPHPSSQI